MTFDPEKRWQLSSSVALRPEPFGALAYHFGNRRLTFLKTPTLVTVVKSLADHPSARAAVVAAGISERQLPQYERALASLAEAEVLQPLEEEQCA
jgi:mycofactocin biosynthesis protein MftB